MRTAVLCICMVALTAAAEELPKTMIKMEVLLQGPAIPAGSFAAKPRVMYRAGTGYCRIEEQPDPDQGIHGLTITNEPDSWMVNLMAKSAQHFVDPGPSFNCRLPIFAPDSLQSMDEESKEVMKLEFGREFEFFKSKGVISEKGPVLQTKQTVVYRTTVGGVSLALFTYGTPERPLAVGRKRLEHGEMFWYSGYGEMAFDPKLFSKPENVKVEESKP